MLRRSHLQTSPPFMANPWLRIPPCVSHRVTPHTSTAILPLLLQLPPRAKLRLSPSHQVFNMILSPPAGSGPPEARPERCNAAVPPPLPRPND